MPSIKVLPEGTRFDGCTLVTGFHGIGATGYWAVKHMIRKLEAKRVAFIDSDLSPPMAMTHQGELVVPYEFYRSGDLVFFKADAPPSSGWEVRFVRQLAEWTIGAGLREVCLIGGLDEKLRADESLHRIVCTRALARNEKAPEGKVLEDDRLIVGPVAVMLNYFEVRDFPAFAILAYASTERADPRAAANATGILSRHYGLDIDVSLLLKGAELLEAEVAKGEVALPREQESFYA